MSWVRKKDVNRFEDPQLLWITVCNGQMGRWDLVSEGRHTPGAFVQQMMHKMNKQFTCKGEVKQYHQQMSQFYVLNNK